jgi:hypothetical protein
VSSKLIRVLAMTAMVAACAAILSAAALGHRRGAATASTSFTTC